MATWSNFRDYASNDIAGINYLAYFTFLSNILVAVWLLLVGIANCLRHTHNDTNSTIRPKIVAIGDNLLRPTIFGAVVMYIFVVGFVFYGMLRWFVDPFPWRLWYARLIDFFVHAVTPVFMTVVFVLAKRDKANKISHKDILYWLVFPLAYVVFSLSRGAIVGWYPYPFFDRSWEVFATLRISSRPVLVPILLALSVLLFWLFGLLARLVWNKGIGDE